MRKISKWKKFRRVFKRKMSKPLLIAAGLSLLLYLVISNAIIQKRISENSTPQFIISRLSEEFDETEFMHMLLTIQEIRHLPEEGRDLIEFVNRPFPASCSRLLEHRLKQMNWAPQAFHLRVIKLFNMYDIYDRVARLEGTIEFLSEEIKEGHLPYNMLPQVELLKQERHKILTTELPEAQYNFMKKYGGIVVRLRPQH
ncbi:MAG: hypothetical protein NC218_11530 [Acetobacter sp.]|nr:hypothetical protein [Acetobacter sp.]